MKTTDNIEVYLRETTPRRANDLMYGIANVLDLRDDAIPDEVYDALTQVACQHEFGIRPVRALMLLTTVAAKGVVRARNALGSVAMCSENRLVQDRAVSLIGKIMLRCQIGVVMILASGHPKHHSVHDTAVLVLRMMLDAELADA